MTDFPEALERRISIRARPQTVFRFFTDSGRFARWWGEGSRIDARPGGEVLIRYPNGVEVQGEIQEIDPPRRIVFTYRYATGIPADDSLVTITLEEDAQGTVLNLRHAFSSARIRDAHVQGWRHQLALFSRAVADEARPEAAGRVDAALAAWGEPDPRRRRALLEASVTSDVVFRDAFSATQGLDDLLANLEAVQAHMPGASLAREGEVEMSHGAGLARWVARRSDGQPLGRGINVYEFSPDGRIARIVGFWQG